MSKHLRIWLFVLLGTLLVSNSLLAQGVITMTTTKAVGEKILLGFKANGNVSIEGAKETGIKDVFGQYYTIEGQTITIRGDVTSLYCRENKLTSLNLSGCTALTTLECRDNRLTSLDLSGCTALTTLDCSDNKLTSLDVSGCTALTTLDCQENELTSLDVSGSTALTKLECDRNQLTSLDVSGCTALTSLYCTGNSLTSLDVSGCTALTSLYCSNNQLTSLDVSKNTALTELGCSYNLLRRLNVEGCTNMSSLNCFKNEIKGTEMTNLVNSLPDRQGAEEGFFYVFVENRYGDVDGNVCLAAHVATAKAKNWRTQYLRNDEWRDYTGLDNPIFTVTYSSSRGGSISISGADDLQSVPYDTELTVVVRSVADGYKLTTLTANGQDILKTKRFKVTANTEVRAVFTLQEQNLYYSVTPITLGKGTIQVTGADDLNAVAPGTELTITAEPAEGYELTELTANRYSILHSNKIVVNEDLIIKAVFKEKTYKVSLERSGEGTLYVSGADDLDAVKPGTELTVTADPAETYELTKLTANGQSILDTKKVVVNEDMIIRAIFSKKTFKVSLEKHGKGTLRAIGADDLNAVPYGTELTIVATPAKGSTLTALVAGGINIIETKKVTIKRETTIEAVFTTQSFAVTLTKEGEGTITATGGDDLNAVPYGTELTIVATPKQGYELTALTANNKNILATRKVVVTEKTTIRATFTKARCRVTLTKSGEGTIATRGASDLNSVTYGTELTIVATPATGYELVSITANGVDITASKKIVVKENLTVKVTFAKKTFIVSLDKSGEGRVDATGAEDLNAVPYGTELTISAQPKMGYELTALKANNKDILATRKVVITEKTTIRATFTKKTFVVTLGKEGEGVLNATGADDLKAVPYGTKLTITATPAEGYELTGLLANGLDILQSKSTVVTEETSIKAIFRKKTFAVKLTNNEHGVTSIVEPVDPQRIPYGTELTIEATPKQGYELTVLTANGKNILSTQRFVVKGDTEVKATFTKKTFAVTLDKEGEGKVDATGANNLKAVPYGTKLTITATPAEGYELTGLLAGGFDILSTKSVEVTGDTKIKAIFTQQTFAVKLTSNEHGEITIAEPVDLKAVPYGTTLTVKATGKNAQCVLTELTANGEDILATRSFVVTDVTEVKATFVDHTGVEKTVKQQTQLYPNPATDYVIVEGVAPASEVTLHSMTGERLYAGRADDRGTLQINLTPYADGVYLVCVAGETYRVVVRR